MFRGSSYSRGPRALVSLKKPARKYGPDPFRSSNKLFAATSDVWSAQVTISLEEQTVQFSSLWSIHVTFPISHLKLSVPAPVRSNRDCLSSILSRSLPDHHRRVPFFRAFPYPTTARNRRNPSGPLTPCGLMAHSNDATPPSESGADCPAVHHLPESPCAASPRAFRSLSRPHSLGR